MEIRPFDNNYNELALLIEKAWPREHSSHIDFTPAYLEHLLSSPQMNRDLTVAGYENGKLISFLLSKSKKFCINGIPYKALFNSMATTDPQHRHLFPYIKIKDFVIKHAREMGYSLECGFIADGIGNNIIEKIYAEKYGLTCAIVGTFGSGILPLNPHQYGKENSTTNEEIKTRQYKIEDVGFCLEIMNWTLKETPCEIIEQSELDHRLGESPFSECYLTETKNSIQGFVGITKVNVLHGHIRRKMGFIYHLFIEQLSKCERKVFLGSVIKTLSSQGLDALSIPLTGYFDQQIISDIGFKPLLMKKSLTNFFVTKIDLNIPSFRTTRFFMEVQ